MGLRGTWSDSEQGVTHENVYYRVGIVVIQPHLKKVEVFMCPYISQEHANSKDDAVMLGRAALPFAVTDTPAETEMVHGRKVETKPAALDYTRFFGPDVWKKGGANPVRQAYLAAKEHPLFRDATDVLETEPKALTATR